MLFLVYHSEPIISAYEIENTENFLIYYNIIIYLHVWTNGPTGQRHNDRVPKRLHSSRT